VGVLDGQRLKVKERLLQWLEVSDIKEGRIFPVTDRQIANIIKAKAKESGLDPNLFSGHSLRAGFITSAANSGADVFRVMDISRHKSVNTVRGYVRRAQLFDGHAGSAFM
jgi:integrase